jgi:ATP synthase protein I
MDGARSDDPEQMTSDQMPQTPSAAPGNALPFAPMLRAAVIPVAVAAPVIVAVCWVTGRPRGGFSALLGVVVAVIFFAGGLYAMKRLANGNPMVLLAGALAVFLGQVIFLALVILAFRGADWLDGKSFALAVLAISLVWQTSQIVAFTRMRRPLYDDTYDEPADQPTDEPADQPTGEPSAVGSGEQES